MRSFNQLTVVVLTAALIGPLAPLQARTRKGDKYLGEGRVAETKKNWDTALEFYQKALSEDPSDVLYQMAAEKARFQAAEAHVDKGAKVRALGQLGEALLEFQKAYALNPGSAVAVQELRLTEEMIQRERKRVEQTGKEAPPAERALTPVQEYRKEQQAKYDRMLGVPELRPLNPKRIDLKMNGQKTRVVFDTLGKVAGINVLWDPDYQPPARDSITIDFDNSTVEQALDYVAILTKSYWKPLSSNTIFITNDNPNKRRDYEEQVSKIFYLNNVATPQELQEIVNAVRGVADLQRVYPYNSQNAILVRAEADRVALAGKIIHDLDKPRSEVVVDVMVMEASNVFSRDLTTALASTGLNVPFNFTPRTSLQYVAPANTGSGTGTGTGTDTGTGTGTAAAAALAVPLSNLKHLGTSDWSTTLPSALLQAVLSDTKTKILQAPQVRSMDNVKATLKIGEKEPTATGSFQPGMGGVGLNPLVNTQFQYIDVGVNVEITPHVHDNGDVSMHVDIEVSSVTGHVNLGGIDQPIIGQRHIVHDIRMHEGEVGLLGGLINQQDTKIVTGIPGLSSIPLLRRLFSGESVDRQRSELMIALVPHIIRRPDVTPENLKGVAVGNATVVHLNYAPETPAEAPVAAAPKPVPSAAAPAATAPPATAPPATAPPATAPPATAPPATAPPATAPPATAPPATAPPATAAPEPPKGSATVRFIPGTINTALSSTFLVGVVVQGDDVASAPMQIQFNPKVLRLNDITRGNFFSQDGQPPVFTKNVENDTGTASVQLNRAPGTPGVSGVGTLVTLSFQAVGRGNSVVSIPNLTVRNAQGQVIATTTPQLVVNVK